MSRDLSRNFDAALNKSVLDPYGQLAGLGGQIGGDPQIRINRLQLEVQRRQIAVEDSRLDLKQAIAEADQYPRERAKDDRDFEAGLTDALNFSSSHPQSKHYQRGQAVGEELARWRAVQTDIDNGYLELRKIDRSADLGDPATPPSASSETGGEGERAGAIAKGAKELSGGRLLLNREQGEQYEAGVKAFAIGDPFDIDQSTFWRKGYLSRGISTNTPRSGPDEPSAQPEDTGTAQSEQPILDANPTATILREDVPLDAAVMKDGSGADLALIGGEPHLILSEAPADTGAPFDTHHEADPEGQAAGESAGEQDASDESPEGPAPEPAPAATQDSPRGILGSLFAGSKKIADPVP